MFACQGFITTKVMASIYSNLWCITAQGLAALDAYPTEGRTIDG